MYLSSEKMAVLRKKVDLAKEAMVDRTVDEITEEGYAIIPGFVPDDVRRVLENIGVDFGKTSSYLSGPELIVVGTPAYLAGSKGKIRFLDEEDFPFNVLFRCECTE